MKLTALTVKECTLVNVNVYWDIYLIKRCINIAGKEIDENFKSCVETNCGFNWYQKKVVDRNNKLIPKKIKEIIHVSKNPNPNKKISTLFLKYISTELQFTLITHRN